MGWWVVVVVGGGGCSLELPRLPGSALIVVAFGWNYIIPGLGWGCFLYFFKLGQWKVPSRKSASQFARKLFQEVPMNCMWGGRWSVCTKFVQNKVTNGKSNQRSSLSGHFVVMVDLRLRFQDVLYFKKKSFVEFFVIVIFSRHIPAFFCWTLPQFKL